MSSKEIFDSKVKLKIGRKRSLVQGIGINDADYPVEQIINGKRVRCPFYQRWAGILKRCYSTKYQESSPTYKGCSVHKDWLTFSTFKSWMEQQSWGGMDLDKDLLVFGNKIYSETTCIFVTKEINNFLSENKKIRRTCPIGVDKHKGKYRATCSDNGVKVHLGCYDTLDAAHAAWKNYKAKLAKQLASGQTDPRISEALLRRFPETLYI